MKIKLALGLALLSQCQSKSWSLTESMKDLMTSNYEKFFGLEHEKVDKTVNRFGNQETVVNYNAEEGKSFKVIDVVSSQKNFHMDYKQQAKHLEHLTSILKGEKNFTQPEDVAPYTCHSHRAPSPDAQFAFAPVWTGTLRKNTSLSFEGNCFKKVNMHLSYDEAKPEIMLVSADLSEARSDTCFETMFIANTELYHIETVYFSGLHQWAFNVPTKDDQIDFIQHGIQTYLFCESLTDEILSVITSLKAFIGGMGNHGKNFMTSPKVPEYMEMANKEFMKWSINWDLEEREKGQKLVYDFDESVVQSGDYFPVLRLDGLDPMIMYGTGSHSGHTVMAMRFDGELYIVESQDAWYWPIHRIQRTPFREWMKLADNADFHVAYMPLSDEMRKKFNQTAAEEYFREIEGMPYGFHNFLYGWVDTPADNWPRILPKELVPVAFSILEHIEKNVTDIFFSAAMNKHLGTKGLNITEIAVEAGKRNMTVSDVMAIVEEDEWKYEGLHHDGYAMVCSAFVTAMWKAAGLFDVPVNAVEWGPKDVYQVDIFNKNYINERPQICKDADPNVHFCQLLGKYRFTFPGFSSIKPYAHMNDHCPSIAPDFDRPEGC